MARGRKRFIAGWGLVGLGLIQACLFAWSGQHRLSLAMMPSASSGGICFRVGLAKGTFAIGYETPSSIFQPAQFTSSFERGYRFDWWYSPRRYSMRVQNQDQMGLGILWARHIDNYRQHIYALIFLIWPLALGSLAGGVPLVLSARKVKRRAKEGQCPACGYALAGLAPGAACPECGKGKAPLTA